MTLIVLKSEAIWGIEIRLWDFSVPILFIFLLGLIASSFFGKKVLKKIDVLVSKEDSS